MSELRGKVAWVHGGGIDTPLLDKRPAPPSSEIRAGLLKPQDLADVNEILISPVLNSAYLGELESLRRSCKT